jgi:hypothetical protein
LIGDLLRACLLTFSRGKHKTTQALSCFAFVLFV